MRQERKPWLDYTGQSLSEIIAHKDTHRTGSMLCAIEEGLLKRESPVATPEEEVFLGVMALEREVNNGGYHQFFFNSSRRYAPAIVGSLERIGCRATAVLTAQAIAALKVDEISAVSIRAAISVEDDARDRILDSYDRQFYGLDEIEANLFRFVESFENSFKLERTYVPPRAAKRGHTNVSRVSISLQFAGHKDDSFEAVRKLAAELAVKNGIAASDAELDGATYLNLFQKAVNGGDFAACESFAGHAFELAREDTPHCVAQRKWATKLIEARNNQRADEVAAQYLRDLASDDKASDFIRKRASFWADLVRRYPGLLPNATQVLRDEFPEIDLTLPPQRYFEK